MRLSEEWADMSTEDSGIGLERDGDGSRSGLVGTLERDGAAGRS